MASQGSIRRPKRDKFKYTAEINKTVRYLSGIGINVYDIAHAIGSNKSDLEMEANKNADLRQAITAGRASGKVKVADAAYKMAVSGNHPSMTQFWLKCRADWKDTTVVEHVGKDGEAIKINNLDDESLDKRIEELTNKLKPRK